MPEFAYTAKDPMGNLVEGTLVADNSALAAGKLRELGYHPEKVRIISAPKKKDTAMRRFQETVVFPVSNGVPLKDLAIFYRQFGTMINAGIPLYQSLLTMQAQTKNPRLAEILNECQKQVNSGGKISAVFAHYNWVFSELQIEMLRAAEHGGMLDQMLMKIADYLEQEIKLRQMISRLTLYPKLVSVAALFMLGKGFFLDAMPAISKLVLGGMGKSDYSMMAYLNDTLFFFLEILLAGFLISAFCKVYLFQSESAQLRYEEFKMSLPGVGKVSKMFALAKFGRAFGAMYAGGLPVNMAIRVSGNASGSKVIARATRRAMLATEKGVVISQAFRETGVFPPLVIDMLHTGEQTGNLDTMMEKVAEYLEGDAETKAHQYYHIFAAAMGLLVGIAVAFAVIKFYMSIGSQVQGQINDAGG